MEDEGLRVYNAYKLWFNNPDEANAFWLSRHKFLSEHGYVILNHERPVEGITIENHFEDYGSSTSRDSTIYDLLSTVNATRVADGRSVCIKRVGSRSDELRQLASFSKGVNRIDPGNHCVPVYQTLQDEEHHEISYIVMPTLHPVGSSVIRTVGDLVELVCQVLLGLNFLHRKRVAHCDCSLHNIMVCTDRDSTIDGDVNVSAVTPVSWSRSRLDRTSQPAISPAKFYFVGFGGAKLCKSDDWSGARVQSARDREPPEFHNPLTRYYNPLLLDIFLIGNMLRRMFLDKYSNVGFLEHLVELMVQSQPEGRINIRKALRVWYGTLPQISSMHRRQKLRRRSSWRTRIVACNAVSVAISLVAKRD